MKNEKLLILSATILFFLSGCSSSEPVTVGAISEIVGTWKSDPASLAINILPDGSVPAAITVGKLKENAANNAVNWEYTFMFDGGQLYIGNFLGCNDTLGSYEVRILQNGNLKFTAVEDTCVLRANAFMGQRVEPIRDVEWINVE